MQKLEDRKMLKVNRYLTKPEIEKIREVRKAMEMLLNPLILSSS